MYVYTVPNQFHVFAYMGVLLFVVGFRFSSSAPSEVLEYFDMRSSLHVTTPAPHPTMTTVI